MIKHANKAQQVVLACATFDTNGNLMVTPEGSLPSRKITNTYVEQVSIGLQELPAGSTLIETQIRSLSGAF